ncbi:RagB/SusD family nutrient uptake outer membrane protein [Chitinophaga arvensicola]|uniref:Starch-binding associating with outer membrane n=1 Tax=Chitinophaga arvensicola TaxID=29529 RepID=A0A1I0SB08_9BACT|nr:RagB/SusD family nutrient uptake outer membrane protein [Chitinophaga arvensicola]SEW53906.1 Starch-binding associating with outer membrane [Chitinophaga arvensicola]
MELRYKPNFRKKLNSRLAVGAVAIASTLVFSCSKVNDQVPFSKLTPKEAFSTPDRIEKSAIGMYDALQNLEFLGGRVLIYSDIRGNDVNVASYFGNVPTFNMLSSNIYAFNAWSGGYRTIFESNYFSGNLKDNESVVTPAVAAGYYAEAKFIRALTYFFLVNTYAQTYTFDAAAAQPGVPLVLTAARDGAEALDPKNKIPRASVKAVYDQMIKDLTEAAAVLPVETGDDYNDRARATKGAAHALLARIYLYQGNWQKAKDYADSVLLSPRGYELAATPADVWSAGNYQSSMERIFSVAMSSGDNPNTNNALGQHYGSAGRGDITISQSYLKLPNFDRFTDLRAKPLFTYSINKTTGDTTAFYTKKFFGNSTVDAWVPILRLAEVILIKAEALARLNTATADPDAITLLNQIRTRAKAKVLAPATQAALIDNILTERRIELAFEGHGEFDFLRTHRSIPARENVDAQPWNGDYVIFPLPQSEVERNPNMSQNPKY